MPTFIDVAHEWPTHELIAPAAYGTHPMNQQCHPTVGWGLPYQHN